VDPVSEGTRRCIESPDTAGIAASQFNPNRNPRPIGAPELKKMKVRPLNDRVLVKRLEEETKTSGGLYIPDSAKEKPQRGVVVAVGKGKMKDDGTRIDPDVAKGDEVLFGKYAGTEISLDGVDHMVLKEEEILAVVG
jgi:chaperonin GroES